MCCLRPAVGYWPWANVKGGCRVLACVTVLGLANCRSRRWGALSWLLNNRNNSIASRWTPEASEVAVPRASASSVVVFYSQDMPPPLRQAGRVASYAPSSRWRHWGARVERLHVAAKPS